MGRNFFANLLRTDLLILLAIVLAAFLLIIVANLRFYHSRFFTISPKIKDYGNKLIAKTPFIAWLLMLTMLYRRVIVDAQRKQVIIERRVFWFYKTARSIPFDSIHEISYNYEDWGPFTSLGFTGGTKDCFSVKLRLLGDEEVHLFNFIGEGVYLSGAPHPFISLRWFFAKIIFAFCGSQEELSQQFVDRLEDLIGVKASP
jgi:hypothetical protein